MKIVATNRKARHDYEIHDKFIAGIALTGGEVKSVKAGHVDLKGSYVSFSPDKAELREAHITPYKFSSVEDEDPARPRQLLLHKHELETLDQKTHAEHLTVVPLAMGVQNGLVKLEIALARGKKDHDKREAKRKRDMNRDAQIERSQLNK